MVKNEVGSKRERILSAARREFLSHGFKSVDLGVFAAEIGISKKTLYQEFSSKEELVKSVLLRKTEEIRSDLSRVLADGGSPDAGQEILDFLQSMQNHLAEVRPAFLRDLHKFHPELFETISTARKRMIPAYFGKLIARGQKAGRIRKDISRKLIVEIFMSLADSIMVPERLLELGLTPKRGYETIFSIIMQGVEVRSKRARRGKMP
jgi:AcrR family transcriptional regulator